MKFNSRIQNFMYNRYGPDELYLFLFKIYFLLIILNLFFNSQILLYAELVIIIITFYRFFSKNITKRTRENQKYLQIKAHLTTAKEKLKHSITKRKNNIYKKCYNCKTTLKLPLPNSLGIKHTTCPKCKRRLTIICLRKEKIKVEVIRRKEKRNA